MNRVTQDALVALGLAQSPLAVAIVDTTLRVVWANAAAARVSDIPAPNWAGRRLGEVLPGLEVDPVERSLRRVLASGEPLADLEVRSRPGSGDPDGDRYWSCIQFRLHGQDGDPAGAALIMREVTERARDQHRLALADQASARIGTTLDSARTAAELLEVAIPRLADAGAVDLLDTVIRGDQLARQARDERMRLRRVALRWPHSPPAPSRYLRNARLDTDPAKPYHQRLVAGLPTFLPDFGAMTTEQIRELDSGTGFERMMAARAAGAHSVMGLPLIARGVIMGMIVLYRMPGSRPFTRADLALAQDLVSRAAVSVDNARLYTRARASALDLQRGLLPRQIPDVPGLELAYRYAPAETAAEVGGDWFDVIPLPAGRCALIVGDVTGHDIRAASVMGQLRTTTRTLATLDLTPAQILTRLDQITADLTDDETAATCLYAVHDARTGNWDMARAGHPLPAVVRPGHNATFLNLPPGMPLGLGIGGGQYQTTRMHVAPHSTLVLYTDGLIESPAVDLGTGMTWLARALTSLSKRPLSEACDFLLATLAPTPADDIALLMART